MRRTQWFALLAALALAASLLAGCAGQNSPGPSPDPAPAAGSGEKDPSAGDPGLRSPEPSQLPAPAPSEGQEAPSEDAEIPPEQPASDPPEPPEEIQASPAEPDPAPEPAPDPAPEPEPEGESVMAGDTYTIAVTLEGGSGRASVESPAKLRYSETGVCWATIVWSSPNFDYMKVDGQRYDPINTEGNSTFEITVSAFDTPLEVIADTVAMSEPHEVAYTLTFVYASMEDA